MASSDRAVSASTLLCSILISPSSSPWRPLRAAATRAVTLPQPGPAAAWATFQEAQAEARAKEEALRIKKKNEADINEVC